MELNDYLNIIRESSTQYGDKLLDLMEQFGVFSLGEVTIDMAKTYIDEHPDMRKRRINYEQMVNSWNTSL